jgi:predicted metalloprotease
VRWTPGNRDNIEDRRSSGARAALPLGIGGTVVLLLLSWATGTNLFDLLDTGGAPSTTVDSGRPVESSPAEERAVDFVDAVTNDVQATWTQALGPQYERTRVVLFRDAIESACGAAESASGPFYCPGDHKVYLDLAFFDELSQRFGAPGDFARAYVVAHEFGHHVQNLLGVTSRQRGPASGPESASVAIELQADCLAGVWGHVASQQGQFRIGRVELDPGDAEEALRAASAIGDDRLQRMSTGRVMPERFTHGTSAQRTEAFSRGMQSGDPAACGLRQTAGR